MTKPVVGIIPLYDDGKSSYWMLPGYMRMLEAAGALPIMLPLSASKELLDQCFALCDGLLFPGGQDVDPAVYNAERSEFCGAACTQRDGMETYLLRRAIEEDKPLLGICRGIQFINAALGGTLYQDLPTEHPSPIDHHMSPPYDRSVHTVAIQRKSRLYDILKEDELPVNSYHHQAIADLAQGLRVDAVTPDGLIEAIDLPSQRFCLAVQWHPELNYSSNAASRKIIAAFAASMKFLPD
jgi:putative glutamine amidotransferase